MKNKKAMSGWIWILIILILIVLGVIIYVAVSGGEAGSLIGGGSSIPTPPPLPG